MASGFRNSFISVFKGGVSSSKENEKLHQTNDKKRMGHLRISKRHSLPVGVGASILASYNKDVDERKDIMLKTRPWFTLWKARTQLPVKREKNIPKKTSLKKPSKEFVAKRRFFEEKIHNDDNSGSEKTMKRQDSIGERLSLRMKKSLKQTFSSATTSTATSSDGYPSEDPDEDDDDSTLVNSTTLSSRTLSIGGADEAFGDKGESAERLTQLFIKDVRDVIEGCLALPDTTEKITFIQNVLESMRSIRNYSTLNLHFVILSSLAYEKTYDQTSKSRKEKGKNHSSSITINR